jgi:hypothetical protein
MAEVEKPKRVRAKRRNYERELANLRSYCEIRVSVLEDLNGHKVADSTYDPSIEIDVLKDVLKRMEKPQ